MTERTGAVKNAPAKQTQEVKPQSDTVSTVQEVNKDQPAERTAEKTLDSVSAYNQNVSESFSRVGAEQEDVDAEKYISSSNKEKLLGLYQMYSQKLDVSSQENLLTTMFGK